MKRLLVNLLVLILSPVLILGTLELSARVFLSKKVKTYFDQKTELVLGTPVPKKKTNEFRVFIFGDSAAYGFPVADRYSIAAWLRKAFPYLLKDKEVQVMNCAWPGKSSHQMLQGAQTVLKYQPDLFIVYSGNNEAVIDNRLLVDKPIYRWNMKLSYHSTFYRYLSQRLARLRKKIVYGKSGHVEKQYREEVIAGIVYKKIEVTDSDYKRILAVYRQNIEGIINAGQRNRVKVLLMTLPGNLRDFPPGYSFHKKDLTADQLKLWNENFDKGEVELRAGNFGEALIAFKKAEAIDSTYADLQYDLGKSYEQTGDYVQAKKAYKSARDFDGHPWRSKMELNDTLRELSKIHHTLLLDTVKLFESLSPHEIISSKLIYDNVHPTVQAQQIITDALLKIIWESGEFAPKASWDWPAYEKAKNLTHPEEWKVDGSLNAYSFILRGLYLWEQKRYQDAAIDLEKGLEMMPTFFESYAFLGDAYTRLGQKEKATHAFETLDKKDPSLAKFLQEKYPDIEETYKTISPSLAASPK